MANFRVRRELTNVSQVKPGGVVTLTLDPGPKYHEALLKMANLNLSDITEIRVKANSDVIHRYTGTELDIMNRVSGFQAATISRGATGFLRIPFDRPKLRQRVLEEDGGINTGQPDPTTGDMITVLKIELQLKAQDATPDANYSPEIVRASAWQSAGTSEGPGTIRRILTTTRNTQGSGRITWSDFEVPSSKFMALNRVLIIPDQNNVTEVEVFRKQDSIFLAESDENDYLLNDGYAGRKAVSGVFPILFDLQGYGGNVMNLASVNNDGQLVAISQGDYRIKVNTDGAMQASMVMEYMGRLK